MAASSQILYNCFQRAKDKRRAKPDLLTCQSTALAPAEPDSQCKAPQETHCVCLAGSPVSVKPLSIGLLISKISSQVANQLVIQELINRFHIQNQLYSKMLQILMQNILKFYQKYYIISYYIII